MSAAINLPCGTWNHDEISQNRSKTTPVLGSSKAIILAICGIVTFAMGALLIGGTFHFKMNTLSATTLQGIGSGIMLIGLCISSVVLYRRHQKNSKKEPNRYHIVSWNVATFAEYNDTCCIRHQKQEGMPLPSIYEKMRKREVLDYPKPTREDRVERLRQVITQFGNPDIICLQEGYDLQELEKIVPEGYSFYRAGNRSCDRECAILWNSAKFSKLGHAEISYDRTRMFASECPDTILLLQDITNGTTLCVGSAHLRGFSLAYDTFDEENKKKESSKAQQGDYQLEYDLLTMQAVQADLCILAGDFNVTEEHYPQRLKIVQNHGYAADSTESEPTCYDANLVEEDGVMPKPVKLDYIFVKGSQKSEVQIQSAAPLRTPLIDFNRPSDHLPIGATISLH